MKHTILAITSPAINGLAITGILIISFMIKGCNYPISYRAFIPKALDSEYKEYERLCKEEVGQVLYAKPVQDVRSGAKREDMLILFGKVELGKFISIILGSIEDKYDKYYYIYIAGFIYHTSWKHQHFTPHDITEKTIKCEPLL